MRVVPLALAAAVVLAVVVPGETVAQGDPVRDAVMAEWEKIWRAGEDFAACGWQVMGYAATEAGQTTTIPADGERNTRKTYRDVEAIIRQQADPIVYQLAGTPTPTLEQTLEEAREKVEILKCIVMHYTVFYGNTLLWYNPPLMCFAKSTISCGIPCLVHDVKYPGYVLLWLMSPGTPFPEPCLPEGQPNCVPPDNVFRCWPPAPPEPSPS